MHKFYNCYWTITHKDKDGNILSQEKTKNALVDEGEESILKAYFQDDAPTSLYIGLGYGTIAHDSTMVEVAASIESTDGANGYQRIELSRDTTGWPTMGQDENDDWYIESKTVSLTADGGTIGPVNNAFLCTSFSGNSGSLICVVVPQLERTIQDGDSLEFSLKVTLQ